MARIKISNRIEGATLLLHETSRRFTGSWVRALNATARTLVPSPGPVAPSWRSLSVPGWTERQHLAQ